MVEDTATDDVMVDLNEAGKAGDAGTAPVLDTAVIAELRATLDPDGNGKFVQRLLSVYQGSLDKLGAEYAQARSTGDWPVVTRVVHTFKSSSANVGAASLAALCRETERVLREVGQDAAAPLLARLPDEVARTRAAVGQALAELDAARP